MFILKKLLSKKIHFSFYAVSISFLLSSPVVPINSHFHHKQIDHVGLLIPLYSGPSYDQRDWHSIEWAAGTNIALAVIINPDNGPGEHLHSDYLPIISLLLHDHDKALGYIPTDYGKMPFVTATKEVSAYLDDYHTNGIFLDEMPDIASKENFLYYRKIASYAHKILPNVDIFANPGINFSQRFIFTGINTFVDEEDVTAAVNQNIQSPWVNGYPSDRFAQIAIAANNDIQEMAFLLNRHHVGWLYSTTYTMHSYNNNPYAHLPADFREEVLYIKRYDEK